MAKRNKYLTKALNSLHLNYDNSTAEFELNTEKDLDFLISSEKSLREEYLNRIEELKEAIETIGRNLDNLNAIKHQIKVEEYQELNTNARVF